MGHLADNYRHTKYIHSRGVSSDTMSVSFLNHFAREWNPLMEKLAKHAREFPCDSYPPHQISNLAPKNKVEHEQTTIDAQ